MKNFIQDDRELKGDEIRGGTESARFPPLRRDRDHGEG
jgi:hypothetical protein